MKLILRLFLSVLSCLICFTTFGQSKQKVDSLITAINNTREQLPVEKLYLQTDKENYVQGDTIWFKAYLLDADYLTPSPRSGVLYAEIDDSNSRCVKQFMFPLISGLTWGNIKLDEKDVPEGSYTIRAYTSWMRNFGEDYVFSKSIFVAASGGQSTLVVAGFKEVNNNVQADLMLTGLDGKPLRLQDLQLKAVNGKKTLFKKNMSTGVDGRININFNIPPNTKVNNLAFQAKETLKGKEIASLTIPVLLNRPDNIDLQFMPEGGSLVDGVNARIGFKAIGEDGKGLNVSGKLYNSKQQVVASFHSLYKGIGSFELTPQAGESYIARLDVPNGAKKSYPLPAVSLSGTGLRVSLIGEDSIRVDVTAKSAIRAGYYLIAQSRGVACYAAYFTPANGASVKVMARNLFPSGIVRFALLNAAKQPMNERIMYIDRQDNLDVQIETDAKVYTPHDSIALHIQVNDKEGKPVRGSFSLAVTDDTQVKADSLGSNIINDLLFTADLKGTVESPGYYFAKKSGERTAALDNLMLTQGWVGYSWKQFTSAPIKPAFAAESEFAVTGNIVNGFNKPIAGAGLILLSHKPVLLMDTVTSKDGRFAFKGLFPIDTAAYVIQAKRKSGSNFNILINVDEFKPPLFKPAAFNVTPWYLNTDTLLLKNRDSKLSQHLAEEKAQGMGTILKEVVIKDKRIITGSKNLNGPGGADFVLDQADMDKAGKKTLYDLLDQKFPHILVEGIGSGKRYHLKGHVINLVIDGVFIEPLGLEVDNYMDYLTAEDIKGVEIMYRTEFAMAYDHDFMEKEMGPDWAVPVYLEVTTHSGNGAFLKKKPNLYIYKPLAFSSTKQFYRPRYTIKGPITGTDQRSTIHWEPNIVTDTAGKATVSFYSADKPAGYTIIMQGTDLNGSLGFIRKRIEVH